MNLRLKYKGGMVYIICRNIFTTSYDLSGF